jgi:hypothetical protein
MSKINGQLYEYASPPELELPAIVKNSAPTSGLIHAYLWWVAPTTHAPAQYHLGAILPVLAYEAARRGIFIGERRKLPRIWTGLIGPSGAAKSTAHRRAIDFTRDWRRAHLGDLFTDPFFHLDGSMPGILAASATCYDKELDASIGIYETDEMSKILSQLDSVSETLCKIFDGNSVQRHLRQFQQAKAAGEKVNDELKNPAFSACFASTPSSLERVTQAYHMEGGLYSRVLWFRGAVRPEDLMPREIHRDAERAQVLDIWEDWSRWLDAEQLTKGPLARRVAVPPHIQDMLSNHLFEPFRDVLVEDNRVNPARFRGGTYGEEITGLYALSRGQWVADEDDAIAAINLVNSCLETIGVMDRTVAVPENSRLREKVLQRLTAAGDAGLRRAQLYRGLNVDKEELDKAVKTLLDSEVITESVKVTGEPGRPPLTYRLRKQAK